jgi:hypothetical protein
MCTRHIVKCVVYLGAVAQLNPLFEGAGGSLQGFPKARLRSMTMGDAGERCGPSGPGTSPVLTLVEQE